jgi:hypothetical protein
MIINSLKIPLLYIQKLIFQIVFSYSLHLTPEDDRQS